MKTRKTILTSIFLLLLNTVVFAQTSPSYRASGYTLKSYTDTYMDVQYFADKPFYKDYGFINISANNPNIELGYSHEFDSLVLSGYMNSNFFGNIKDVDVRDYSTTTANNDYSFDLLLGFKNKNAVKMGFNLYNNANQATQYTPDHKKLYVLDDTTLITRGHIAWGGTFSAGKVNLKPKAEFHYANGKFNNYETSSDNTSTVITRIDSFTEIVAFDFDIKTNNHFNHIPGIRIAVDFQKINMNNEGAVLLQTMVSPSYKMAYIIEDKLQLLLKTGCNLGFNISRDKSFTDKTSKYLSKRTVLSSYLDLGVNYTIKPKVLALNVGTSILFPQFSFEKTEYASTNLKDIKKETSQMVVDLTTGLNWNITKNVAMDLGIDIPVLPKFVQTFIGGMDLGVTIKR